MPVIAIVGAGPIGAATAHHLARRGRVNAVRLIDGDEAVAVGKALDIQQAAPIHRSDTRLQGASDPLSAVGADVIVIADDVTHGEWSGDRGLAVVDTILRAGSTAPVVFAGPAQTGLLEQAGRELGIASNRLVGSAAGAVVSIVRGLAGLELGLSSVELAVVGRPPRFVVGWSTAVVRGALVIDHVAPHRLLAMSQSIGRFWPPGSYAIASATARIVEGLAHGSRQLWSGLTVAAHGFGPAGTAVLLPLELGRYRVLSHVVPSLTAQERTAVVNSL
jgi:malate dehydrogenase